MALNEEDLKYFDRAKINIGYYKALVEHLEKRLALATSHLEHYHTWSNFYTLKSNKMDYNKLAKEIHQDQKDAGWYDEPRTDNVLILLIKSELFEALEAYRKKPTIEPISFDFLDSLLIMSQQDQSVFIERFREKIKDRFEDELADITIRLLDFVGYKQLDLDLEFEIENAPNRDILTTLINMDNALGNYYYCDSIRGEQLLFIILTIRALADSLGIHLAHHIRLKLAYNKTRGKRHGNKAV